LELYSRKLDKYYVTYGAMKSLYFVSMMGDKY